MHHYVKPTKHQRFTCYSTAHVQIWVVCDRTGSASLFLIFFMSTTDCSI